MNDYNRVRRQRRTLTQIGNSMRLLTIFLLSILASVHATASVTATVDRTVLSEFDLVTLTIRASDNAANLVPNLTPLDRDFEIVSNSNRQNSSISIVNGRTTSIVYNDHVVVLRPKRMGNLTIPTITAGQFRTQPINISVQKQSAAVRQQMNQLVFFETTVDTNETYVQGQIIYSVKLFYTEAIGGDFPQPPALDDAVIETIENEKRYEAIVSGRRYYVLEKSYAIFPQRSGELVIPRETFVGTRGRGGLFSQRQRVNAVSDSHTVNVKRIPTEFSGENWIPAKSLAITESWAVQPPVFTVGEPVNRQLTISAVGLSDSLLPPLGETEVQDAKVYADPPSTQKQVGVDGITAIQVTTVGVVPTKEGELTLPEIRIPWWNTLKNREEVAIIPAATYQVKPATGVTVSVPTVTVPVTELSSVAEPKVVTNPVWQYAAAVLGILWILSTWQWFVLRREIRALRAAEETKYVAQFDDPDENRLFKDLMNACKRNLAAEAHRQLFLWAKARFPDIQSVNDLASGNENLAGELKTLEGVLYGAHQGGDWSGKGLASIVTELRHARRENADKRDLAVALNPA